MGGLLPAVAFLTRIPVHRHAASGAELAAAVPWFPVVGLGVGAVVGGVAAGLAAAGLSPMLAGMLAVGAGLVLTGAFHEDGWADTFDGLAGGYTTQRRLEIMKDSRLGTFGAAALFVALASKATLVGGFTGLRWWHTAAVLAVAGAVSRSVAAACMLGNRSAASGLGSDYLGAVRPRQVLWAVIVGTAAAAALGVIGIAALSVATVVGLVPVLWARRAIGGVTGDILGAVQVAAELGFLVMMEVAETW